MTSRGSGESFLDSSVAGAIISCDLSTLQEAIYSALVWKAIFVYSTVIRQD